MEEITIACRILHPQDDAPQHCMVFLGRQWAEDLMAKKRAFEFVNNHHNGLYCLEFWGAAGADWGTVSGLVSEAEGEWWYIADDDAVCDVDAMELETTKVTDSGVRFSAAYKNADDNNYFETPEIPWVLVEQLANAVTPELLAAVFPPATYTPQPEEEEEDEDDESADDEEAGVE